MQLSKYHGLGNDYLVIDPADLPGELTEKQIRRLCNRRTGAGADGVLLGPLPATNADFGLRIFNPDGSEAEKSGNGLRIFARSLWDRGLASQAPCTIATAGGVVTAQVEPGGRLATVAMGQVSFDSREIPVAGPPREVLNETLLAGGVELRICAATLGNPHCVVLCQEASAEAAQRLGPLIEADLRFPPPRQRPVHAGAGPRPPAHRDLGAGRGLHPGLGQQRLRGRGRGPSARPVRRPCDRGDAGRRAGSRHCCRLERDPTRASDQSLARLLLRRGV
jgi:diaminopimelate epimerase